MMTARALGPFAETTWVEVRTDAIDLVVTEAPDGLVLEATPCAAGVELWMEPELQGLTQRIRIFSRAIA
jgi:hypothetical protein